MNYMNYYRNEIKAITGELPTAEDGMSPEEFDRECPLPQVPAAMREYYLVAGKHRLNTVYNPLLAPAELELRDGFLFFMDENQAVCRWAVKEDDLRQDDPEVFQVYEDEDGEIAAYSEEMSFSSYLAYAFAYFSIGDCCLRNCDEWEGQLNLYMERWKEHRICVFCKQSVEDLDEFHPFGFITMDQDNPDYQLNYRGAHRKCLK